MVDTQVRRPGRPNKSGKPWRPYQSPEQRERRRQRSSAWKKANREKLNEYMREWQRKNRKRKRRIGRDPMTGRRATARWRLNHPEKATQSSRLNTRNRRAAKLKAGGVHTPEDISRIMEDQRGRCAYCRRSIRKSHHVDHIIPLSKGGSNWPKNLQLTCKACNLKKNAANPLDFARRIGRLL